MEEPIRILIIGMHDKIGGVETFLMNYYRNIDRNKVQFDFISIYDKLCFEDEILQLGGKVYKIPSEKKHPVKYYKMLKNIIKDGRYRIVHINMLSAANSIPIIVAKKCNVKNIIIHSHNTNTPKGCMRKILDFVSRPILKKGTEFWACSEKAGKWLFGPKSNFQIINNAIDYEVFKKDEIKRAKIRKELNIENKIVLGNIGRFSYQKNQEFLLEVFEKVHNINKNTKLILVGEGKLEKKLREKAKLLNIDKEVIFYGTTNHVEEILNCFDIFLLPSRFEGLPVTGIEAQAVGNICLFSSNISQEVKISENCYFIELNEEHWTNLIIKIVQKNKVKENNNINQAYNIKSASKLLEKKYFDLNKIKVAEVLYGLGNGGVETVLKNYLNTKKIDVSIITQTIDSVDTKEFFEKKLKMKIYEVGKKKNLIKYTKRLRKIYKNNRFDIVHCHMTLGNWYPNFIASISGIEFRISHSHFAFEKETFKSVIYKKLGMIFSNKYMACSKDAAIYLFGKDYKKAFILKNKININKFIFSEDTRNKKREELNIKVDDIIIGNIGRMIQQKNQEFIVDIFKKLHTDNRNFKLLLIGSGELKEKLIKKIEDYNLKENVIILENRNDINELLMAMDIFVFPSIFEGLGIAVVEAQLSGLQCFISEYVPREAIIYDDRCNIVSIENQEKWISKIYSYAACIRSRSVDMEKAEKAGYSLEDGRDDLINYYGNLQNYKENNNEIK